MLPKCILDHAYVVQGSRLITAVLLNKVFLGFPQIISLKEKLGRNE